MLSTVECRDANAKPKRAGKDGKEGDSFPSLPRSRRFPEGGSLPWEGNGSPPNTGSEFWELWKGITSKTGRKPYGETLRGNPTGNGGRKGRKAIGVGAPRLLHLAAGL